MDEMNFRLAACLACNRTSSILLCEVSSVGRAPALQAGCRRFEPVTSHHYGELVELADTLDSGSSAAKHKGSSPLLPTILTGISSVGLERSPDKTEVPGSNPSSPANLPAQLNGKAPAFQAGYVGSIPIAGSMQVQYSGNTPPCQGGIADSNSATCSIL